jgi:hypothetical protein
MVTHLTDDDIKTVRPGSVSLSTTPDDQGRDDPPAPPTSDPPGHDKFPGAIDDSTTDAPGQDNRPGAKDDPQPPPDDAGRDDR